MAWYVNTLANNILAQSHLTPRRALAAAIALTADRHRNECDLAHPGTPAAAVGIIQLSDGILGYLILGDITLVSDRGGNVDVITDSRISQTAATERAEADVYPVGSPEKMHALTRMKEAELKARNVPGGYWAAATDPSVADHSITGHLRLAGLRSAALLTDGATRLVKPFGLCSWSDLLGLLRTEGPDELIRRTRNAELSDPAGMRWPRNKRSDDASVVYVEPGRTSAA